MTKKVEQQLEQLHGDLIKLLKDLEGYSEARLNEQPKPGQWSVFQIMHHLILAEGYSMQYVERKLSHQPKLKNSTPITGLRKVIITSYLKSPLKRKAPKGIDTESFPEYSTFWEVAKKWKRQREELKVYLDQLPDDFYKKEIYKHPFGGRLSISGMLSFFQEHFNRHQRQIYRNLKTLDAVKVN